MIWKIAKKEFLLNLMTFKFAVGTIVCVVLTAVFMPVLVSDYQQRLKNYNENVAANNTKLEKVKAYRTITPTVYKPPVILSVFSGGLEKRLANSAKIEPESIPEINPGLAEDNPFLTIFPILDVSLIFKTVISILALLIAYDVVSGEKEWGTLKLILSGTVARHQVLLGKLLAGLMTLAVPITVAFVTGLLVLEFSPMVDLAGSDWARIGLIYFTSLIFISAMYNIGLLFSCLAGRSAISLMLGLFFWVVFAVVIPNGTARMASQIQPLEPKEKMDSQVAAITKDIKKEAEQIEPQLEGFTRGLVSMYEGAFGGRMYCAVVAKPEVEYRIKRYALEDSLQMKYAGKFWEIKHHYLSGLFKQKHLASNLSRISPISLYESVMSALAGTDAAGSQYFVDRARTHRNDIIEYIRSKTNNFSLPSYFTPCSEEDMIETERLGRQWVEAIKAKDKAKEKATSDILDKWLDRKTATQPSIDIRDMPQFVYQPTITGDLRKAIIDLGLLVFVNVLFFVLSFVLFVKYDVR